MVCSDGIVSGTRYPKTSPPVTCCAELWTACCCRCSRYTVHSVCSLPQTAIFGRGRGRRRRLLLLMLSVLLLLLWQVHISVGRSMDHSSFLTTCVSLRSPFSCWSARWRERAFVTRAQTAYTLAPTWVNLKRVCRFMRCSILAGSVSISCTLQVVRFTFNWWGNKREKMRIS